MYQKNNRKSAVVALRGRLSVMVAMTALAVIPAGADPIDGGWTATPAPTNGNCFVATTAHISDDPAGLFGTSIAIGATMGPSDDMRMMLEWTPRQIHSSPILPKRAGITVSLRLVSRNASGRLEERGTYSFTTYAATAGAGLLAVATLPAGLILNLRNETSLDVYRGGALIRHIGLDGFHQSFQTLMSCENALGQP